MQRKGIALIVDEAYIEYTNLKSAVSLVKRYDNLFVTRTFSKAYGLANFRIGYVVASEENVRWVSKLVLDFPISTLSEAAAVAALKDQKYLHRVVKRVLENKRLLVDGLTRKGYQIFDGPNFILVKVDNVDKFKDLLAKNNIVIRPKKHLYYLKNFIRITIGEKRDCKKILSLM